MLADGLDKVPAVCPSPRVVLRAVPPGSGGWGLAFMLWWCWRRPEKDANSLGLLPSLEYYKLVLRSHLSTNALHLACQLGGNKGICLLLDNVIGSSSRARNASRAGSSSQGRMWYLCADSGMLKPSFGFFFIQQAYRMPCVFGAGSAACQAKLAEEAVLWSPALQLAKLAGQAGGQPGTGESGINFLRVEG